jgi:DNA-binding SARP family transcriptional activator/Flp pilus assembly protein TadD
MRYHILGPVEMIVDGSAVVIARPQRRAVLAFLLLHANRTVSTSRLVEALWAGAEPPTARAQIHTLMTALRRTIREATGSDPIASRPGGYTLVVEPGQCDLEEFTDLAERGRRALTDGQPGQAAEQLRQALSLWRGPALDGITAPFAEAASAMLEQQRLAAHEDLAEVELALGRHADLAPELAPLVDTNPLRERLTGQLMLALYRSGRPADALAVARKLRRLLADEQGLDPGRALTNLERAILRADPALDLASADPALPRSPAQLPATPAHFVGRGGELKQLDALLPRGDGGPSAILLTAIDGSGGVGKTALAVYWAQQIRDRFPDGQLYINLHGYSTIAPLRPIDALARFLRALDVPAQKIPSDLDEAASLYRSLLADRRMLVLLDNAHTPHQVRPLLPGTPGSLTLITSRDRLSGLVARDGMPRVNLDVLTAAESVTLLERIIGTDRVAAEPQAAAALAAAGAYLPLALRVTAAQLADHPTRRLADHLAQLREGNRLATLEIDGDEDASVRATFDLSYAALPAQAQRLFRVLGLAPGPDFTADTAATLLDTTPDHAGPLLDLLANAHLIQQHAPGRYTFHDLLRLYAKHRAEAEDPDPDRRRALRRLLDRYLHISDAAARLLHPRMLRLPVPPRSTTMPLPFTDNPGALAWLDAERPNLIAAITHTADHGPHDIAWLLADALRGDFYIRRHTTDWFTAAQAAIAAADRYAGAHEQAVTRFSLGLAYVSVNDTDRAIDQYTQALNLARQAHWDTAESAFTNNLGVAYLTAERLDAAAECFTAGLVLARRLADTNAEANSLGNLALVHEELGQLETSLDYVHQALTLYRTLGSTAKQAIAHNNLGGGYRTLGRSSDALKHLTEAVRLHRQTGNRDGEGDALNNLALLHHDLGRHDEALRYARAALVAAREGDDRQPQTEALSTLGAILLSQGNTQQAETHYHQALDLAHGIDFRCGEIAALLGLARLDQTRNHHDSALTHAQQALTLANTTGVPLGLGRTHETLASIHLARGDLDQATTHARQALDLHRTTGYRLGQARSHAILGRALHQTDNTDAAETHWHQAWQLLTDIGTPEADTIAALLPQAKPDT